MTRQIVVNQDILEIEYAVRGPLAQRAAALRLEGRPIIPCHIGNPQAFAQEPIALGRQVLGLLEEPARIGRERKLSRLPEASRALGSDELVAEHVLELTETILSRLETGMGAYTESKGAGFIREAIARFIDRRDGAAPPGHAGADPEHVFLTNGASEAARLVIEMLVSDRRDGIMVPTPHYPL